MEAGTLGSGGKSFKGRCAMLSLNKLSPSRIFICVFLALFLVFALTLATQAAERLVDINTLMVEKLPPADAFIDWQAVSCGSMYEGTCEEEDLSSTNAFMVALDDDGNCYAKKYEVWVANNFQMAGSIYVFITNNLNATLRNILTDGQNHGIWVFAICHEDDD